MGGSVKVSSEVGVGTEFTVCIQTKCQVKPLQSDLLILSKSVSSQGDVIDFQTNPACESNKQAPAAFVFAKKDLSMEELVSPINCHIVKAIEEDF